MVYLIHFEVPYKGVQHYIGFCKEGNLEKRLGCHRKGRGSRLLRHIGLIENIDYRIVRVWPDGDPLFEKKLKSYKKAARFCPSCSPKYRGIYIPKEVSDVSRRAADNTGCGDAQHLISCGVG